MDYIGEGVCLAALFSMFAAKGCIAMGPDMYAKVMESTSKLATFNITSLGTRMIAGKDCNTYQVHIYTVWSPPPISLRFLIVYSQKMVAKSLEDREDIDFSSQEVATSDQLFSENTTVKFSFPNGTERYHNMKLTSPNHKY